MTTRSGRARVVAKIGVDLPKHVRLLRIPRGIERAAAFGLWSAALCWTRGEEEDGFCPAEAVESYATDEIVARLVDVGLFTREEKDGVHGYRVFRYEEWNETKSDIEKRLRSDRRRQKNSRANRNNKSDSRETHDDVTRDTSGNDVGSPGNGPGSGTGNDLSVEPAEKSTGVRRRAERETDDGAMGLAIAAWKDGIREVSGRACTLGHGPACAIVDALVEHCPDPAQRVQFARTKAVEWAKLMLAAGKLLNPHGFVDWLNTPKTASGVVRAAPRANGVAPGKQAPADFLEVAPESIPDHPLTAKGR